MIAMSVCQFACHVAQLSFTVWLSFGAAFAKLLWPLAHIIFFKDITQNGYYLKIGFYVCLMLYV